jgi:hypothetical protein
LTGAGEYICIFYITPTTSYVLEFFLSRTAGQAEGTGQKAEKKRTTKENKEGINREEEGYAQRRKGDQVI